METAPLPFSKSIGWTILIKQINDTWGKGKTYNIKYPSQCMRCNNIIPKNKMEFFFICMEMSTRRNIANDMKHGWYHAEKEVLSQDLYVFLMDVDPIEIMQIIRCYIQGCINLVLQVECMCGAKNFIEL